MASHEDIFLDERTWFTSTITQVLKKLRRVLRAIQDDTLENNEVFDHVSSSSSLEELFSRVGPIASVVLHGLLSDEEWKELVASEVALTSRDVEMLISARLGRQARLLGGLKQSSVRFANKMSLNAQQQHEYAVIMKESKELLLLEDREDEQDESSQSLSMQVQAEHKRVSKEPVKKKQRIDDDAPVVAPIVTPSSPIREVVLVESEAEGEAERSEDHNEDGEDIAQILEEASASVNTVVEMLRWYYSVAGSEGQPKLEMGKIEPPNSDLADPNVLTTRRELVMRCLNEEQSPDECRLEQWAKLLRFWRFVKRAFVIVAIFAKFEKTKPRGGTTMAKRFTEALRKLKCAKPISYAHALNYRRVGEFFLEYPRFVYQLRLTKLKDWNARIDELKERVITEGSAWSVLLDFGYCAIVEEENEHECCSQGRGRILKCSDCGNSFHECCAGYEEGSVLAWSDIDLEGLSAGVTLSVKVYCQECLESRECDAHSVARRIAEVVAVAKFFNAEGCRFRLQPVKGDGYCLFGILEKFARQHLESCKPCVSLEPTTC